MEVQSVTGPADTADLGFTLMHEHILACTPGLYTSYPHLFDRDLVLRTAIDKLGRAHECGVETLVDMSPADFHRDPELAREASAASGVRIIHATGGYWHTTLYFERGDADVLAALFVSDIREGMNGTDIRAGILKAATGDAGVTPSNEKMLRAVARAHRQTGVPISTHTQMSKRNGLDQQRVFQEEGVDLKRVVIGHSNDVVDVPYLEQLIDNGSWIGMDRFGLDLFLPEQQRIELLVEMCRRGYDERIVISHDASALVDFVSDAFRGQPYWNWQTISNRILPAVRERGVSEAQIRRMTVENPRRIFEAQGAY
jgi:phosphotriesterase-related protein